MTNNFRVIYLYIVSLISLIMIVGGIVVLAHEVTSYFYPDSYVFFSDGNSATSKTYDYNTEKNNLIRRENYKNEKIKNSVVSVAVIAIGGIMYKYHWNMIEKEKVK